MTTPLLLQDVAEEAGRAVRATLRLLLSAADDADSSGMGSLERRLQACTEIDSSWKEARSKLDASSDASTLDEGEPFNIAPSPPSFEKQMWLADL